MEKFGEIFIYADIIAIVILVIYALTHKIPKKQTKNIYEIRGPLLTKTELTFYNALLSAVPKNYLICPKVRIADVLDVKASRRKEKGWLSYFNTIAQKHFDFVIVDNNTLEPVCAIELDDPSHNSENAKKRDAVKNRVCKDAGFSLLRIPTSNHYDSGKLRRELRSFL